MELYQIIKSFQTCLRFEKNKYYILIIPLCIILFIYYITEPMDVNKHFDPYFSWRIESDHFFYIFLLSVIFLMPFERYQPYAKFTKEYSGIFKSLWFKSLRLTLGIIITMYMLRVTLPNSFNYHLIIFKRKDLLIPRLFHQTIFDTIVIWWFIFAVVYHDLSDIFFRWLCKKLDQNLY